MRVPRSRWRSWATVLVIVVCIYSVVWGGERKVGLATKLESNTHTGVRKALFRFPSLRRRGSVCLAVKPASASQRAVVPEASKAIRERTFTLAPGIDKDNARENPGRFRIFSYNVLADGPRYALSDYHGYSPIEFRRWKSRYPRILSEIHQYNPDVICLQEITRAMFQNSFYRDLQKEYTGLYAAKSDRRSKYQTSAMFVRTQRFKVLNGSLVSFARLSEDYFRSLGAHEGTFNDLDLMARMGAQDDKALIALLQDRNSQKKFVSISTHLYWNPKEPHVKSLQAYLLSQAAKDFLTRHNLDPDVGLVVAGDFNSLPNKTVPDAYDPIIPEGGLPSGAYKGLTTGVLTSLHPDHPCQRTKAECIGDLTFPIGLTSVYSYVYGSEPLITTKTDKFSGTLDYIFVRNLKVASALDMPFNDSSITKFGPIPNAAWPSDHIAICSDLIIP